MKNLISFKLLFYTILSFIVFLSFSQKIEGGCTGTPTACSSLAQGDCPTCGCTWNTASCVNSGTCATNTSETNCNNCSCAGCSWGGSSCPWVGSWDGKEWQLEHEAFPFAAFKGVQTTTYDSLPNLKCIDGEIKVKIYEGLPEKTFLNDFSLYKISNTSDFIKPDLDGIPRAIKENKVPNRCSSSNTPKDDSCVNEIEKYDDTFWEPEFDATKTEDWLEIEYDDITSDSVKLYLVARKQPFLTTYYEYMAHMMGKEQFYLFSELSQKHVVKNVISNWWDENLKMKVEVWDGKSWIESGLISAGYHMPGSGADDFLVSIKKLDSNSDTLKIRFRFMTGAFGIDYISLDTTPESNLISEEIEPKSIYFNDKELEKLTPVEMVYDDTLILTYDCVNNEKIHFSIDGYYLLDNFQEEREKNRICAWSELIHFFLNGKENVVRNAKEKGLYKEASCISAFTQEEIDQQQKSCQLYYYIWAFLIIIIMIVLFYLYGRLSKNHFTAFVILIASIMGSTYSVLSTYATTSCLNTINCSNCLEAACNTCSQCTWQTANCSGTANICSAHDNESDCTTCGCNWEDNGAPLFTNFDNDGPTDPGDDVTFTTSASDPNTGDTIKLVVCKTQGVTGTACDGGSGDTWCTSSYVSSNPSCSYSIPNPNPAVSYNVYPYIFDNYDIASDSSLQGVLDTFTVNNSVPIVSNVTINGGNNITLNAGTTKSIDITGTVTDNNGCEDIDTVLGYAYRSGMGYTSPEAECTGGTKVTIDNYTIHTFTSSGTFTVTGSGIDIEYLVVAGGGGGGSTYGGGGGAGGYLTNVGGTNLALSSTSYTITVGAAGTGSTQQWVVAGSGGNSSIGALVTAVGGGGGGSTGSSTGANGGSGGGGAGTTLTQGYGGSGTSGQGNDGGDGSMGDTEKAGGGGGGSSTAGTNASGATPGSGGTGSLSSITGSSVTYSTGGDGGLGYTGGAPPEDASPNTGNGGEGGGGTNSGGDGGSGIVIIRYTGCSNSQNADYNNCYPDITCTVDTGTCTGGTDASATYTCTVNLQYFADPTDTNTLFPTQNWLSTIKATDDSSASGNAEVATGVELNSLVGFNISTEVNYGALGVNQSNDPLDRTTLITPTGNVGLDHELSGPTYMCTDFPSCTGDTIGVGYQKYSLSSSTSYSSATALTTTPTEVETNVPKPTTISPLSKYIWWGILIPSGTMPGSYDGNITVTGIKGETASW